MDRPISVDLRNYGQVTVRPVREPQKPEPPREEPLSHGKDRRLAVKILDIIIDFSIFMIFFGLPLYFTNLAYQGVIFEKQLFFYFWLLLGLITWAAKSVMLGEMNIARTPLDIPILGFWLACLASVIFSVDRWHSFWGGFSDPSRGFMSVTAYIVAYYFIFSNFNVRRLKIILAAVMSSGLILALWTALAVLGIKFWPDSLSRYFTLSLTGSISSLGILFSSLVPVTVMIVLRLVDAPGLKKLWKKILVPTLLISLALDLFLILALYNYVPWLGLFIGVALFLIFILAKIIRLKAEWIWLPMAVFVFIMILRMIGPVSIVRVNLPVEVSLNYQTSMDIAARSLKNKLLVGSGLATYGYDFSLYRPKDFNLNALYNLRFFQGSGIIAEAVPTVGIVGTFFLVVIVLSYIGSGLYLLYRDKEKNKLYSLGIFSAAAIFIVDILSLRPDGATLLLAALFATLALAASVAESGSQPNRFNLSLKASPKFALALAFVFMAISAGVAFLFVFLGKIYVADVLAKKSAENISQNPDAALNYLGRAINLNRWESNYYIQLGQYYMALVNDEVAKGENSRDINKIQEYLNYSIATTNQGKNMSKNNVASVETLALIYENAGFYVADSLNLAEENYKRALELEPHNPVYYIKLGRLKINMTAGKKEIEEKKALVNEAADLFRKAVDEKSNYAEGYYQLSLAEEALNQLDQAIENVSKAFQINPRNSEYLMTLGRLHQQRNKEGDKNLTEQYYKAALAMDDKNINGHFNLGLFYERDGRKNEAKNEYNKIIDLLEAGENNGEMIKQIQKMISNINQGIENTPENLGLVQPVSQTEPSP